MICCVLYNSSGLDLKLDKHNCYLHVINAHKHKLVLKNLCNSQRYENVYLRDIQVHVLHTYFIRQVFEKFSMQNLMSSIKF